MTTPNLNLSSLLLAILVFCATSTHAQLTELNTTPNARAQEYDFLSNLTGYALMWQNNSLQNHFLNKTTNGGDTWSQIPIPAGIPTLLSFSFPSQQAGYIFSSTPATLQADSVYKTTDKGQTWQNITPVWGASPGSGSIDFLDDQLGFIRTSIEYYYRTTDGGQTWDSIKIGNLPLWTYGIRCMDFYDADHGIFGWHDNTFLYKGGVHVTTDGGQTWKDVLFPLQYNVIGGVKFASPTTVYAAPIGWGAGGRTHLYKSTNAGDTWDTLSLPNNTPNPDSSVFTAFDFRNDMEGVVVIDDMGTDARNFYETTDGGLNWTLIGTTQIDGIEVLHLTANMGYASSSSGFSAIRLEDPTGIAGTDELPTKFYPNPVAAGTTLNLLFDSEGTRNLTLTDLNGRLIHRMTVQGIQISYPLSHQLEAGLYLLSVEKDGFEQTIRVVVN